MKDEAVVFARGYCRQSNATLFDRYAIKLARIELAALASLTNYYDAVEAIPAGLSRTDRSEYVAAVRERCVLLARESLKKVEDEIDLR